MSVLSDVELRNAFKKFTPQSDWDRFFSCKIQIPEIEELIDELRRYRNAVAHLKFFYKDDYKRSNKIILKLNKAIIEAIKLTEEKDFSQKNAEALRRIFSGITEAMSEMLKSVREAALTIVQSETFQLMKNISTQIKGSGVLQDLRKSASEIVKYLSSASHEELTLEDDEEERGEV